MIYKVDNKIFMQDSCSLTDITYFLQTFTRIFNKEENLTIYTTERNYSAIFNSTEEANRVYQSLIDIILGRA